MQVKIMMTPSENPAQRVKRISAQRHARAQELLAHAEILGIEIGWEGNKTTFHPATECPPSFIQEATILSAEIKALRERRGH